MPPLNARCILPCRWASQEETLAAHFSEAWQAPWHIYMPFAHPWKTTRNKVTQEWTPGNWTESRLCLKPLMECDSHPQTPLVGPWGKSLGTHHSHPKVPCPLQPPHHRVGSAGRPSPSGCIFLGALPPTCPSSLLVGPLHAGRVQGASEPRPPCRCCRTPAPVTPAQRWSPGHWGMPAR